MSVSKNVRVVAWLRGTVIRCGSSVFESMLRMCFSSQEPGPSIASCAHVSVLDIPLFASF